MITRCKSCGVEFNVRPSYLKKGRGKFCSNKCRGKADTMLRSKENSPLYKNINRVRKCETCGTEFKIRPFQVTSTERKCCSKKCMGIYQSNHRGSLTDVTWTNKASIIRRIRGSWEHAKWKQHVAIKDNFTCKKCGVTSTSDLQAHHVKPFHVLLKEAVTYMPLLHPYSAAMAYTPMWNVSNGIMLCVSCHKKTETYGGKFHG